MESLKKYKRIVVKIGSSLLVDEETSDIRLEWLRALALDIKTLKERKQEVIVVSSGSIALGRLSLGLDSANLALEKSQAAAAVGQIRLARAYESSHKINLL